MGMSKELLIEEITDKGFAIAYDHGRKIYVDGAYLNERVKVEILEEKPTYASARLEEILMPSPKRITPKCTNLSCGGCAFNQIESSELLRLKNKELKTCLDQVNIDQELPLCIGMDEETAYRNKAIYYVRDCDGSFYIGFFAKNSHDLVAIDQCYLEPPFIAIANRIIRQWASDFKISAYSELHQNGLIKNLIYRKGNITNERMLIIVATKMEVPFLDQLLERLKALSFDSIWLAQNDSANNNIWGEKQRLIYGSPTINTILFDLKFKLSPKSFFQLNSTQCEKLYQKILDFACLKATDLVFDLYCGIGTISLCLAQRAKRVYAIEIIDDAILNARENASINNINNVEFFVGKSEVICEQLVKEKQIRANVVVVDPPRKGCDQSLINTLLFLKAEKLVYVSCNPKSLARDLKFLQPLYKISQIATVDMFPNTMHVETVVLMLRISSGKR